MNPYVTLKQGDVVVIARKCCCDFSNLKERDVGKVATIQSWEWSGRRHNKYISAISLSDKYGSGFRVCIHEISTLNPNFEPEADFVICVGCGATFSEKELMKINSFNTTGCPSCGMLDPKES